MKYKITGTIGSHQVDLTVEKIEGFDVKELLKEEARNKQGEGAV